MTKTTKWCPKCNTVKAAGLFYRNSSRSDGLAGTCKACAADTSRAWTARNPTYNTEWSRKRRENDPERVRMMRRAVHLRKQYGMTNEDFDRLFASQRGLCALCGNEMQNVRGPGRIAVDHDHQTGEVRGILHATCNVALGVVEIVGAEPFAAYLLAARRRHLRVV